MSLLQTAIIYSAPSLEIITSPWLTGPELGALARASSADWLRSLPPAALQHPVSLEILSGGRYYYVADAVADVTGTKATVASLRAKRQGHGTDWSVRIWDRAGADLAGASAVLIGDTIATGTTLAGVLKHVADELRGQGCPTVPVFVFAIAGAQAAQAALAQAAAALAEQGSSLHLTYANAELHLADDGTDLKLVGPTSKWDARAASELPLRLLGPDVCDDAAAAAAAAAELKCACFDWGDRFSEPKRHLEDVRRWMDTLTNGAPAPLLAGMAAAEEALGP